MKFKTAFTMIALSIGLTMSPQLASAAQKGGSNGGGGGDMESEFKAIALNIRQWIEGGGSTTLKLPPGVSNKKYKADMLRELKSYSIEMVSQDVKYGGSVKTCVNRRNQRMSDETVVRNRIICNQKLFREMHEFNIEGAYRLVHHEFAGAAGLEQNRGPQSDYRISDQISQFLEEQMIRRLPVGDLANYYRDPKGLRTFTCGRNYLVQTHREVSTDGGPFGDFRSLVSPHKFVLSQFKDKTSLVWTTLLQLSLVDMEGTYEVGENVTTTSGGGRVEDYSTNYLVPIVSSEKRWKEVVAYVRVSVDFRWLDGVEKGPAFTPGAMEAFTTRIEGIFSPQDLTINIMFDKGEDYLSYDQMTSKVCHDFH